MAQIVIKEFVEALSPVGWKYARGTGLEEDVFSEEIEEMYGRLRATGNNIYFPDGSSVGREFADPSSTNFLGSPPFVLAESMALGQLASLINDYVLGNLAGTSVLIAGHRGSGKSALTAYAFQRILRAHTTHLTYVFQFKNDMELNEKTSLLAEYRPILVRLHAHQLFNGSDHLRPNQSIPADRNQAHKNQDKPCECQSKPKSDVDYQSINDEEVQILVQLVIELHRAVKKTVVSMFQRCLKAWVYRQHPSYRGTHEELINQLQYLLDNGCHAKELQRFWHQYGLIRWGVLYSWQIGSGKSLGDEFINYKGQGARELYALYSLCDLYRRVIDRKREASAGTISSSQTAEKPGKAAHQNWLNFAEGSSFWALITGGGAVTTAGGLFNENPVLAGLSLLVAILGSFFLGRAREVELKPAPEEKYIKEELQRDLPDVISRLRAARLVPIFFIDELDKVGFDYKGESR